MKEQSKKIDISKKDNPFLEAKRQWNFILGDTVNQKKMWQFIALFSLTITLACAGGLIYVASQSKFVPYLVEVNKLGDTVAVGELKVTGLTDERVTKALLANFIRNSRTITPDMNLLRKNIFQVYSMLNGNDLATIKMDEWLGDGKLQKKSSESVVTVEIINVLKQTEATWQVDWIEKETALSGQIAKPSQSWRAILTIYHIPPTNEKEILQNPTGIKVKTFTWQPNVK